MLVNNFNFTYIIYISIIDSNLNFRICLIILLKFLSLITFTSG